MGEKTIVSRSAYLIVKNVKLYTIVSVLGNFFFQKLVVVAVVEHNRYLPNSCCAVTADRLTEVKT
jgi:hypothetical protein